MSKKNSSPWVSLWEKFFPSVRDREKEMEASKRFQYRRPACLNGCVHGFKPNWFIGNMLLCPANWEYAISDFLVPRLYSMGIDNPNKVTLINCLTWRPLALFCLMYGGEERLGKSLFYCLTLLLPLQQLTDCADGQMARRYGLGSEFGAWFDHVTDNTFGLMFSLGIIYRTYLSNESNIWPTLLITLVVASIGGLGNFWIQAEEAGLKYDQMSFMQKVGMYQMLFLSYIYPFWILVFLEMGWLK